MSRPTLGLALGSGGWRGLAHIGVIKSLLKHNIPIDYIAGCSAGALIGGLYAALNDIEAVEEAFKQLNYRQLLYAFSDLPAGRGVFKGRRGVQLIRDHSHNLKLEDLEIPFRAVATDLVTGKPFEITQGDLGTAVRASGSVPFVFEPVKFNDKELVDGATTIPVPVETVVNMGADVTLGVNLYTNIFPLEKEPNNALGIALRTSQLMLKELARINCEKADVSLNPEIQEAKHYQLFTKFIDNPEVVEAGEAAADAKIEQITALL